MEAPAHLPAPALVCFLPFWRHRHWGAPRAPVEEWCVCSANSNSQEPSAQPKPHLCQPEQTGFSAHGCASSLNTAENKALLLLCVQDDLLSLLWMLKRLESRWIVLAEPGSSVGCSFSSALVHMQDLVLLLPVLQGLALKLCVQQADFLNSSLSSSIFLFPLYCSSSLNFTQHFPLSCCWRVIHVVMHLCNDETFWTISSLQQKT